METEKKVTETVTRPENHRTDPSTLTTAQLLREIEGLKELLYVRIECIEEGIETAHQDLVRVPTDVQDQVKGLKELIEAKIEYESLATRKDVGVIEKRFELMEAQRREQKQDTATAIDAALKSAKEAVIEQNNNNTNSLNKSESSMSKQFEQMGRQMTDNFRAIDGKIDDIKERVGKIEGIAAGIVQSKATQQTAGSENRSNTSIIISVIVGLSLIIFGILNYFK